MWIVERREDDEWRVVARCEEEQEADTVLSTLQIANPTDEFRKREEKLP